MDLFWFHWTSSEGGLLYWLSDAVSGSGVISRTSFSKANGLSRGLKGPRLNFTRPTSGLIRPPAAAPIECQAADLRRGLASKDSPTKRSAAAEAFLT